MSKLLKLLFIFIICILSTSVFAAENKVLTGGIMMVPNSFYGTWRVVSKLLDTDSPVLFKENNIDLWNLSRVGDVITLRNPFNGASAEITIDKVSDGVVVFKKYGKYNNKHLTDIVEIKLNGETFKGYDTLQLDTMSDVSGKIIKTETAKYSVSGEKILGDYKLEH
ncbi:hypothetical protein HDR58_08440 [bacterium]|nr:hypothetical protein [bacterium]